MNSKGDLTCLLVIVGEVTGETLVGNLLSCVAEHHEARILVNQMCRDLLEMERDGHVKRFDRKDGRYWNLTDEAARDWATEYLAAKPEGSH